MKISYKKYKSVENLKLFQLKSGCHYLILKIILEDPATDKIKKWNSKNIGK